MTEPHPFITQALGLAAQALCLSNPNPRVGCVLVSPQGQVIGQGHTQQAGGPQPAQEWEQMPENPAKQTKEVNPK